MLTAPCGEAHAGPDPIRAGSALAQATRDTLGDVVAGSALLGAALLATAGDAVALLDRSPVLEPVTGGAASRTIHALALGLSYTGTEWLEALRGTDVERWPEHPATYLTADPFVGRVDTALSGLASLSLSLRDAVSGPGLFVLELAGAEGRADAIERWRSDAAVRALGPAPVPAAMDASDAQRARDSALAAAPTRTPAGRPGSNP